MVKFVKLFLIIGWLALIFFLSSISFPDDPAKQKTFFDYIFDKDVHILLYGILAYLVISFLAEYKIKFSKILITAVLFCYFYGITDEWHQGFVLNRGVSYWDLVFDVIGAIFGVIVYCVFSQKKKPQDV